MCKQGQEVCSPWTSSACPTLSPHTVTQVLICRTVRIFLVAALFSLTEQASCCSPQLSSCFSPELWQVPLDDWCPCCAPQACLQPGVLHCTSELCTHMWSVQCPAPGAQVGGGRHMQTWLLRPIPGPRILRYPLAEQPPLLIPSARMGSAVPVSQTQRKGVPRLLRKSRGAASLSLKTPQKKQG